MADRALRDAERRLRETGDPHDRVALLRALLRAGGAGQARVEVAAHALDAAAIEALEGVAPDAQALQRRRRRLACDLRGWGERLAAWGREPCARAALAVGRLVHGPEPRNTRHAVVEVFGASAVADDALVAAEAQALTAASAWLRAPAPALVDASRKAAGRVDALRAQHPLSRWRRARVASGAARVVAADEDDLAPLTGELIALAAVVWTDQAAAQAAIDALRAWAALSPAGRRP